MSRPQSAFLLMMLLACGDDAAPPSEGGTTSPDESSTSLDGSTSTDGGTTSLETGETEGGPVCDPIGKPEMTGPITGLQPSYLAGDPIDVGVPIDEDTARVIVGVYEVGSELYLGGTAEDFTGPTTASLSFFAGVVGGETGTFYLAIELCSTTTCTTPFVRNTYQRADRFAPLANGETYVQTREFVGTPAMPETCETDIPVQSFTID